MGVKKAKKVTSSKAKKVKVPKSATSSISSALGAVIGGKSSSRGGSGKRSHKQTPEKLAKQILILKLKKRLFKMKYGGR